MNMSNLATRLTLYALLSAIETDLRTVLSDICLRFDGNEFFNPVLRASLLDRFRKNQNSNQGEPDDEDLLQFIDYADSIQLLLHHKAYLSPDMVADLRALQQAFDPTIAIRNRVMHSRPIEPDDFSSVWDLVQLATSGKSFPWIVLRQSKERLSQDPSFVLTLKIPDLRWERVPILLHNLPLPEFDDTGYIGRAKDREDICKLILGHHRIITLVGEGGIGKTATLLKCIYDLIDKLTEQYDALIWVSLKTQTLTARGVQDLKNCITSTTGILQEIGKTLGPTLTGSLERDLEVVLDYMQTFRIFLVIDNLETIQDDNVRQLFRNAPPSTKIVITSRIGLGELEFPRQLLQLSEPDAANLFRKLVACFGVMSLGKLPQADVISLCRKLVFNPLAIRWFVSSVQTGVSPQSLLKRQSDVVEFCVRNVYDKLTADARQLLQTLLIARRPMGDAELAFLSDLPPTATRRAIYQITGTMMVRTEHHKLADDSLEARYLISELAMRYLSANRRPPQERVKGVNERLRSLLSVAETAGQAVGYDPYDHQAILVRSANDRVAARLLQQALAKSKMGHIDAALVLLNQAKDLAPLYSEVHKIAAFIKANAEDLVGAEEDYECALELMPESPAILRFYGNFRLYKLNDSLGALPILRKAHQLDPNSRRVHADYARVLTFLGHYEEAWAIYESLLQKIDSEPIKIQILVTDMASECLHRLIDRLNERHDKGNTMNLARSGIKLLCDAIAKWPNDSKFGNGLLELIGDFASAATRVGDGSCAAEIVAVLKTNEAAIQHAAFNWRGWGKLWTLWRRPETPQEAKDALAMFASNYTRYFNATVHTGTIRIVEGRNFGFIKSDIDNLEYYFNSKSIHSKILFHDLRDGFRFTFLLGENRGGACAVDLQLLKE